MYNCISIIMYAFYNVCTLLLEDEVIKKLKNTVHTGEAKSKNKKKRTGGVSI